MGRASELLCVALGSQEKPGMGLASSAGQGDELDGTAS